MKLSKDQLSRLNNYESLHHIIAKEGQKLLSLISESEEYMKQFEIFHHLNDAKLLLFADFVKEFGSTNNFTKARLTALDAL